LKVFIAGPPASGKSYYAKLLSDAYGVPTITIQDLVQMGYALEDDFGDEIRRRDQEIRDKTIEDYTKTKKKKDPELVRENIKVRLPDDILHRLLLLKLKSAGCKNKGFILDGYPRNQKDAENVFLKKLPAPVGEEGKEVELGGDPEFPGFEKIKEVLP